MVRKDDDDLAPYGSANDLPTVKELAALIRIGKTLTRFVERDQRHRILEKERELQQLTDVVDRFCELLGPMNWVFHDDLNIDMAAGVVHLDKKDAERAVIEWYKNPDTLRGVIDSKMWLPEFAVRSTLIDQAYHHYLAGRYAATALTLLPVMDGFVNDVERDKRQGLHARDESDLIAWDSITAHHLGLAHAHRSFTKTFKRTVTDEVFELYRHGIVHGMVVNFDNDVVATKAWNRLFAVVDWAVSAQTHAEETTPQPTPGWRERARSLSDAGKVEESLRHWTRSESEAGDPDFGTDPVVVLSGDYLRFWQSKNYGAMSDLLAPLMCEPTRNRTAGMLKEELASFAVAGFSLQHVNRRAPAVTEVDVSLSLDVQTTEARLRWHRFGVDGMLAAPIQEGEWRLMSFAPWVMISERRPS